MDKQGVSMDIWTTLQNAQVAHIPTPPTHTYPQGFAFGLTHFACQTAILKIKSMRSKSKTENRGNAVQLRVKLRAA